MLNVIDFSNGIRAEEIQENFEYLHDEIKRERINIGGCGIASGLDIEPLVNNNQFAIKISPASIITKTGEEIYIEEQIIDIDRPQLISNSEILISNINNQITLKEIPYALNRTMPSQYLDSYNTEYSGIKINYQNSTKNDDGIRIKAIDNYTLTLTGLVKRGLVVNYSYSADRLDTVYIDMNNNIQVKSSSITSTTPSAILPKEYKYLIAYILIESDYKANKDDIPHANISVKKDLRDIRNIFTDKDGNLYICGVQFSDIQFISFKEPVNPKINDMWFDDITNTLYVYRNVYKSNHRKSIELIDDIYNNTDLDHYDFNTDIKYKLYKDTIDIYVNNSKLTYGTDYIELFNDMPCNLFSNTENMVSDKFRIYKRLHKNDIVTYNIKIADNSMMWIPVNKESYVNTKEIKIYGVDEEWPDNNYWSSIYADSLGKDINNYKNKYKYFIFDLQKDKRMLYTPYKNELSIMINQVPLHKDQYEEITLFDAYDKLPQEVLDAMKEYYNYDIYSLKTLNEEYDNFGIGFILKEPLDALYLDGEYDNNNNIIQEKELYVEVHVNRAVSSNPIKRKFQRYATYIYEDSIKVENTLNNSIINITDGYYRYNENQLEVYINGVKLTKNIDYIEGTDLYNNSNNEVINDYRETHAISRQFKIIKDLHINDIINYRITSTYCSYDHINSLLDEIELDYNSCVSKVETLYNETFDLYENTTKLLSNMQEEINILKDRNESNPNEYLRQDSLLSEQNLPASIINNLVYSLDHISEVITYNNTNTINVTDIGIRQNDYITIVHRNLSKDTFLIKSLDYTITDSISINGQYQKTELILLDNLIPKMSIGDTLIISGIKFGRGVR